MDDSDEDRDSYLLKQTFDWTSN